MKKQDVKGLIITKPGVADKELYNRVDTETTHFPHYIVPRARHLLAAHHRKKQ